MSLTEQLSNAVVSIATKPSSPQTKDAAKKAMVDTIACMAAGASAQSVEILRRMARVHGGSGRCSAVGLSEGMDFRTAALINGTAGHALDYDDVLLLMPGHPSVAVFPAVLAAAELGNASGAALLDAYVAGVEIAGRFGDVARVSHYSRGWHATGTIGAFGALAGVACLLKLERRTIVNAIGILTSLIGGVQRNFGTMTKPLHAGQAAANALWAALAAREGFTADPKILESPAGFFDVFNGSIPAALESMEPDRLFSPSVFEAPGIALKRFPCNYALHRNLDAFMEIVASNRLAIGDIARVECLLPPGETRPIMRPRPTTGLEGKFSLEYTIAAIALEGTLSLRSFTDKAIARPEILSFLPRIEKREAPECAGDIDGQRQGGIGQGFVRIIVTTSGGQKHSAERHYPKGAPEDPLEWSEIRTKFDDCLRSSGASNEAAASLFDDVQHLETLPSIDSLTATLRSSRAVNEVTHG